MWRPCARTAKVVDKQLECGLNVEAMMLPRPGGEAWVGASPHGAAEGVFFLCPSVLFPGLPIRSPLGDQGLLRRLFDHFWSPILGKVTLFYSNNQLTLNY